VYASRPVITKHQEEYLEELAKKEMQILINALNQLPKGNSDRVPVVKLPEPTTRLPREKRIPKPKEPTKWEKFAAVKGIQKTKKSRMVWDEETQKYRPRFGYKSKEKDWVLEVPDKPNQDPFEDQFAKKKNMKDERIAKNEYQRLKNIKRAKGLKGELEPTAAPTKDRLATELAVTHKSTASLGKFMDTLPKEKKIKGLGKKRKFDGNYDESEKERQKKMLKRMNEETPVLDKVRAANIAQHAEEMERSRSKQKGEVRIRNKHLNKKGKGGGGKQSGKGGKAQAKVSKMMASKGKTLGKRR